METAAGMAQGMDMPAAALRQSFSLRTLATVDFAGGGNPQRVEAGSGMCCGDVRDTSAGRAVGGRRRHSSAASRPQGRTQAPSGPTRRVDWSQLCTKRRVAHTYRPLQRNPCMSWPDRRRKRSMPNLQQAGAAAPHNAARPAAAGGRQRQQAGGCPGASRSAPPTPQRPAAPRLLPLQGDVAGRHQAARAVALAHHLRAAQQRPHPHPVSQAGAPCRAAPRTAAVAAGRQTGLSTAAACRAQPAPPPPPGKSAAPTPSHLVPALHLRLYREHVTRRHAELAVRLGPKRVLRHRLRGPRRNPTAAAGKHQPHRHASRQATRQAGGHQAVRRHEAGSRPPPPLSHPPASRRSAGSCPLPGQSCPRRARPAGRPGCPAGCGR